MSYQLQDVIRLHGRDVVFATKYWQQKLLEQLRGKTSKSLVLCNSFP